MCVCVLEVGSRKQEAGSSSRWTAKQEQKQKRRQEQEQEQELRLQLQASNKIKSGQKRE